jgi:hypothetical protein
MGLAPRAEPDLQAVTAGGLVLNSRLLDEDATVMAAIIAHKLQHMRDVDVIACGLIQADCTEREARAFEGQSRGWRAIWTSDLSTGTRIETNLPASPSATKLAPRS